MQKVQNFAQSAVNLGVIGTIQDFPSESAQRQRSMLKRTMSQINNIFQRTKTQMFEDIEGVEVIKDDMLVWSKIKSSMTNALPWSSKELERET